MTTADERSALLGAARYSAQLRATFPRVPSAESAEDGAAPNTARDDEVDGGHQP
ncbi:hypothetical protein HQQ80_11165 [Microbacteriaceae bacterium VKM Ac-2855]|nr:hypothetical protein [Microbacteriaceae bacterium VKM Ac-2855]